MLLLSRRTPAGLFNSPCRALTALHASCTQARMVAAKATPGEAQQALQGERPRVRGSTGVPFVYVSSTNFNWENPLPREVTLQGRMGTDVQDRGIKKKWRLQTTTLKVYEVCTSSAAGVARRPTWYDLKFWGSQWQNVSEEFQNESFVQVTGKLHYRPFTRKDGTKGTRPQVGVCDLKHVYRRAEMLHLLDIIPMMGTQWERLCLGTRCVQ